MLLAMFMSIKVVLNNKMWFPGKSITPNMKHKLSISDFSSFKFAYLKEIFGETTKDH